MSSPIALILGSGPRVGAALVQGFASQGYKIVTTSRSGTNSKTEAGHLSLQADLASPDSVPGIFSKVKAELGASPSVVIYNAATFTRPPVEESVLSTPLDALVNDFNVNALSAYVAAQQLVDAWQEEGASAAAKKTFIFTGNISNVEILRAPMFLTQGVGKAGAAYWIGTADILYGEGAKGIRFFYADERYDDGKAKYGKVDGEAHAEFYNELTKHDASIPWHATFVKHKGYVKF